MLSILFQCLVDTFKEWNGNHSRESIPGSLGMVIPQKDAGNGESHPKLRVLLIILSITFHIYPY